MRPELPTLPDPIFSILHPPNRYWYQQSRSSGEFCHISPVGFSYNDRDFAPALFYMLTATAGLARATSPTEVDQRLTEALGSVQTAIWHYHADKYQRVQQGPDIGVHRAFMEALIRGAAHTALARYEEGSPSWRDAWALLCALPAVLPPSAAGQAEQLREGIEADLGEDAAKALPAWFGTPPMPRDQIHWARDGYGGRIALFIETADPVTGRQATYLIDFDAAASGTILGAREHLSLQEAMGTWETTLTHTEAVIRPQPVTNRRQVAYLDYVHDPSDQTPPNRIAPIMREYWRVQRRMRDAIVWLMIDGLRLPIRRELFYPCETGDDIAAFAVWLDRHDADWAPEDIAWFVEFWTEFAAPGSQRCIAPERLVERRQTGFFWDWSDDTLNKVLALLPAWTRYCADRDGLSQQLTAQAIATLLATIDDLEIPDHHRL